MVAKAFFGSIEVTGEAPLVDTTQVSGGESYEHDFLQRAAVGMDGRSWMNALFHAAVDGRGTTSTSALPRRSGSRM